VQVQVQSGAQMTLIERHLGGDAQGITASSCSVRLGRDAQLQHYRLQDQALDATWIDTLRATLDSGAQYQLSLLSLGGGAARSSVRIRLAGQGSHLLLNGASLADAKRVLDTVIRVEHEGRDTRSEQLLRAVANGQSGISMASRVEVSASAGGADSRQSLKGLITAKGAEINLRPQLEILTDEVTASHGATTGALDENMLFYLLSRGLDADTARKLLEWAFIADVMSRIELPALRRQVEMATVTRMGNSAAMESLL
jgi:Fe-S cluster assembly protein SufD